jgi:multidrug efflux pump subunit AcrA (membrane-fusion protein)
LTAEEKAYLASYDPQAALDAAAAAARKKAESDAEKARKDLEQAQAQLKDAQTKLDEAGSKGKTDLQKLQEQVTILGQQVQAGQAEKAKLIRQQKLDDVIRASGLQFVKEVDGGIMRAALVNEFGGLTDEDLATPDKTKPVIETFRARNKAVILDDSGFGTGTRPGQGPGGTAEDRQKAIEQMTPEQRQEDMKKRGIL